MPLFAAPSAPAQEALHVQAAPSGRVGLPVPFLRPPFGLPPGRYCPLAPGGAQRGLECGGPSLGWTRPSQGQMAVGSGFRCSGPGADLGRARRDSAPEVPRYWIDEGCGVREMKFEVAGVGDF